MRSRDIVIRDRKFEVGTEFTDYILCGVALKDLELARSFPLWEHIDPKDW